MDHVANERLYSKPVQPEQILNGKVPPPTSFKPLIDLLISSEDGRYEKIPPISDADSDYSSAGYQNGLEHTLVVSLHTLILPGAFLGNGGCMRIIHPLPHFM